MIKAVKISHAIIYLNRGGGNASSTFIWDKHHSMIPHYVLIYQVENLSTPTLKYFNQCEYFVAFVLNC